MATRRTIQAPLVITIPRTIAAPEARVVKLSADNYMRIQEIRMRTGLPIINLMDRCVAYALDHMEIRTEGCK